MPRSPPTPQRMQDVASKTATRVLAAMSKQLKVSLDPSVFKIEYAGTEEDAPLWSSST